MSLNKPAIKTGNKKAGAIIFLHRLFLFFAALFIFSFSSAIYAETSPVAVPHQEKTIVVGGDNNFPPFEFIDSTGQPTGYNVDLAKAIAREMGLQVRFQLGPWAGIARPAILSCFR